MTPFIIFPQQKHDIPCVRRRAFLVFEEGHSLCSKKDISCVRGRTFLVFEEGQSLCSNHEKCTCHFLVNSADRPRIWANRDQIRTIPGTIGQIRQKVARGFFRNPRRNVRAESSAPKAPRRKVRAERFAPKGSRRKVHAERFTPKGSRRKVHAERFTTRNFQKG